jgi:hypothetical protein
MEEEGVGGPCLVSPGRETPPRTLADTVGSRRRRRLEEAGTGRDPPQW